MTSRFGVDRNQAMILAMAALIAVGGFLAFAAFQGFSGFPLDDAWIHQVYARNLAQLGEWSFNAGQPSGGSTSPLWSFLLAGAYLFHLNPVVWSGLLGGLALWITGCLVESIIRVWYAGYKSRVPWVGLFIIFEWHMVWAAVSGMETALYICLVMAVFFTLQPQDRQYFWAGALIGLCAWVRPDGITLLGPAFFVLLLETGGVKQKAKKSLYLLIPFLIFFMPYLFFNFKLAGSVWPSTFSAKQAEYQASGGLPFIERLWNLFLPFLAGGGVILLPGLAVAVFQAWRGKKIQIFTIILWFAGYLLLYALRLPVNYQHGRYMMPAMVAYFLVGLWGMLAFINNLLKSRRNNLVGLFWKASLGSVTAVFLLMGCLTYKTDAAIIQTEMVQTARWINENTPENSRLGAHDIGALGYFSHREITDLAGLVNPEVIPIIRDEKALSAYMDKRQIDYFVTFPGWYPSLTADRRPIFQTNGVYSLKSGGENMAVYKWK